MSELTRLHCEMLDNLDYIFDNAPLARIQAEIITYMIIKKLMNEL